MRILVLFLLAALAACAKPPVNRALDAPPLQTVSAVDLDRYLGRWYEIARLPNSFEDNCDGVTADYSLRDDGKIKVVNTCRLGAPDGEVKTANGKARIVDATTNAKLKVSFFGPFYGDYWIIDLAEDYSLSIVGEPTGRYLWVLSRTPEITDDVRNSVIAKLAGFGYDASKLYFTRQPPAPDNP
ncbi:MAG: lipocalin family protein [Parvularculaceae bacterium]